MVDNNHHIITGDLKSARLFGKLIVQRLGAKLVKNSSEESSNKISQYVIDIMGNPAVRKQVTLKIVEDLRDNTGEIKIEHGAEFIQWQSSISCLCDCCAHNISKSRGVFYVCIKAAEPNEVRNNGLCPQYRFSELKYRYYTERT